MSKITFCKRGGQDGILTNDAELDSLSFRLGRKHIDEVIPVPSADFDDQVKLIENCTVGHYDPVYWENEDDGGHGWCCPKCGTVVQWG